MKNRIRVLAIRPLLIISALFTIVACNQDSGTAVSQGASPPAFETAEAEETRSNMAEMGHQLALLDRELTADEYNQIDQLEVVSILQAMELAGSSFESQEAAESHYFLQGELSQFLDSLTEARMAASDNPPRYYLAGRVAGGCTICHSVNF